MKNLLKEWRGLVSVLVYLSIMAGLIFFVVFPLYGGIESKRNEIQEEIANQELKNKKLQELPRIKQQYDFVQSKENKLELFLNKEQAVVLVKELEEMASQTQNVIKIEITENKEKQKSNATGGDKKETILKDSLSSKDYLEMTLGLEGTYASILGFMYKLETADYLSDVIDFQINKNKVGAGQVVGSNMFASANVANVTQNQNNEQNKAAQSDDVNKLNATINVVFYLKK